MSAVVNEHLGIAVVDDDPVFLEITCALLSAKSAFLPFPASSSEELFSLLLRERIDCIVLDYDLGDETGFAIKTNLEERYAEPPPIVMLTGSGRESTAIKAFRMGVNDYLPKLNLQPKNLVATISKVVAEERQRLTVKAEHKRLVDSMVVDQLTGLAGRVYLDDRLAQLASLNPDARRSYAIILVDFLQYQFVAERFGLKSNEVAVRAFGKHLKVSSRSEDICGRYENGIFLIIADVLGDPSLLDVICRRISEAMSLSIEIDTATLKLSACVVGAICRADGSGVPHLLDPAMKLLSDAKASGSAFKSSPEPLSTGSAAAKTVPGIAPVAPSNLLAVLPAAEQLRTTDRRREIRHRVLKRGVIHVLSSNGTFNCTVRNMSANGASLRIDAPFAIPETFDLEVFGSGFRRRVALRWQNMVDCGVEFVSASVDDTAASG